MAEVPKQIPESVLVVGAGFVGLATAVFLARKGCHVTVVEKSRPVVESLQKGRLHFHEPGLKKEMKAALKSGRLTIKTPGKSLYETSSLVIIAIDSADQISWKMKLTAFERIISWVGSVERKKPVQLVFKSTNVLGFADLVQNIVDKAPHGDKIKVIVNPEFLREGMAYEDTANPWRVVIGARDRTEAKSLAAFYGTLYPKEVPIIITDWRSAELIKLGSNLYLAHRLAFINEIAEYARGHELDIDLIRQGIGADPRIGSDYFDPGIGFGGSCLPKDCHLINSREAGNRHHFETAKTSLYINDLIIDGLIYRLRRQIGRLTGYKITLLGAAFKAESDDTRGSRAVALALNLKRRGAEVAIYEPFLKDSEKIVQGNLPLQHDLVAAVKGASAIVVGAAHRQFTSLKPETLIKHVKEPHIIDYFRLLSRTRWEKAGFRFIDHG